MRRFGTLLKTYGNNCAFRPPPPIPPVAQVCDSQAVMVPSFLRADLDFGEDRGAVAGDGQFGFAIEEQLHGPAAAFLRELRGFHAPQVGGELAAEAAAHVVHVDVDVGGGNVRGACRDRRRCRRRSAWTASIRSCRPSTAMIWPCGSRQQCVITGMPYSPSTTDVGFLEGLRRDRR